MSANTGGPAFPLVSADRTDEHVGMSLRDYFAGQALTGIIAAYSGENGSLPALKAASANAYDYADAMLAARDK